MQFVSVDIVFHEKQCVVKFLCYTFFKMASNFTKKCMEMFFLIFRKSELKIADETLVGTGCHYNDCCLCSAVKKIRLQAKEPLLCFGVSDPFKPYNNNK